MVNPEHATNHTQDALLMTVGGTPEPLIHSLSESRPRFLALICSQDSFPTASEVKKRIEQGLYDSNQPKVRIYVVDNPADLLDCHAKVTEALSYMKQTFGLQTGQIKIDFTGGTKAMSAAAVLAAVPDGYEFIYVSGDERTKGGVGTVVTGTEQVVHPLNPWVVLEEPAIRQIILYADCGQWMAALSAVEDLEKRSDESRKYLFKSLYKVLDGLREWDRFNHRKTSEHWKVVGRTEREEEVAAGKTTVDELYELASVAKQPHLVQLAQKCMSLIFSLKRVNSALDRIDPQATDPVVADMVSNALRAAKRHDYDYAALLLYRALELFVDRRLKFIHNINNSAVAPDSVPEPLRRDFVKRSGDPGPDGWKLGLTDSARLLDALGDSVVQPLVKQLQDKKIDISARNLSWLIHGDNHVSSKQFESFKEAVLKSLAITDSQLTRWPDFNA